ncbi:MAG: hypothetical protein ACF8AM_02115 [Rhodopirellula sp. JB055]|uniref:hypothetical protein n=1 Tax=Rhodopirellula sp. JB055 TaxID=3342846 RepID=UPI003709E7A3
MAVLSTMGDQEVVAQQQVVAVPSGPIKDVTFQALWLIESDDANRVEYAGAAREALTTVGFGRLVPAGSAMASVTVGLDARVDGGSRYGQLQCQVRFLNTTESGEVQAQVEFRTQPQSGMSIATTVRAPVGKWFLVGAADSRTGLPTHADDGKRAVMIMKVNKDVITLE